ncbi:hypothetical protein V1511DRAFT_457706 [Dipodascopsis uninucleata]
MSLSSDTTALSPGHHPLPYPNRSASQPTISQTPTMFDQTHLLSNLGPQGQHALMAHEKTLDLYRANAKKSQDPIVLFEFANFLIHTARNLGNPTSGNGFASNKSVALIRKTDSNLSSHSSSASSRSETSLFTSDESGTHTTTAASSSSSSNGQSTAPTSHSSNPVSPVPSASNLPNIQARRDTLYREAASVLRKLADRGHADAQYLLGDGYASGIWGKRDLRESFMLFVAATKHGHSEAAYRAALCYEQGWGTAIDVRKAVQFYRASASRNHPGAMLKLGIACYYGQLGLTNNQREGVKWLGLAAEAANEIFPQAPYELAGIYETGFMDIVIPDPGYAAQLYVKSAELGYAPAAARLGHAYEYGRLGCPQDPALSVHYYTVAALSGDAGSMLALCAWYMVGAPPVLERSEEEAYEWARKAAENGLPKAMFAVGHFCETGVGTQRDLLEANMWYHKAAECGDDRAAARLKTLNERDPNSVQPSLANQKLKKKLTKKEGKKPASASSLNLTTGVLQSEKAETNGQDKECIIM